jgi:ADP-ribose pyrophosphatase YjhB (NUDIX family)
MTPAAQRMYLGHTADATTRVRVGCGVIVRDHAGLVLLERRSDCGMWGLPGGRIEPGETVEAAARREVFEETGLEVRITRLLGVYSDPADGRIVRYSATDLIHLVDVVVEAEIVSGTLVLSHESVDLRFFGAADAPDEIVPPAQRALRDYFTRRESSPSCLK